MRVKWLSSIFIKFKNYRRQFPKLNKFSFSLLSANPNFQFFYFGNLVHWLLEECGNQSFPVPGEFDDPNVVASNMVNVFKEIGLEEIPPLKLKSGTGEIVIQVLEYLSNLVIKGKGIVFSKPIFKIDDKTLDAEVDEDAEITANLEIDEKEWQEEEEEEESISFKGLALSQDFTNLQVSNLKVDRQEWALQVERVTPLLLNYSNDSRNWRMHLETMNFHYKVCNLTIIFRKLILFKTLY